MTQTKKMHHKDLMVDKPYNNERVQYPFPWDLKKRANLETICERYDNTVYKMRRVPHLMGPSSGQWKETLGRDSTLWNKGIV